MSKLNDNEPTNNPQLHLRAVDGEKDIEATKIVFHKMNDGSLFFEIEPCKDFQEIGAFRMQANFDKKAMDKLRAFIKNEKTY